MGPITSLDHVSEDTKILPISLLNSSLDGMGPWAVSEGLDQVEGRLLCGSAASATIVE